MGTIRAIFGEHEENTLRQIEDVATRAEHVALMADGHLGYVMPIGGVAAYRDQVSVVGIGFDIACGNCAIRTDLHVDAIRDELPALADEIQATISFGVGRSNHAVDAPVDHPLFDDPAWEAVPEKHRVALRKKARDQLGTVGSGNHYNFASGAHPFQFGTGELDWLRSLPRRMTSRCFSVSRIPRVHAQRTA